jgi:hypothetical protein
MFDEQKDKHLDEILDAFLSQYSAQGPRAGLERRILAGLRARAAQRRRVWTLMLAAPTAAALLIGLAMNSRKATPLPSRDRDTLAERPALAGDQGTTVAPSPERNGSQNLPVRRTKERLSRPSLLQVVDAMHRESNLVFEHEKFYLDPATQSDPRPAQAREAAAPSISIQDLGVKPIAIKELTADKGTHEEGKL